jgi:hypothetical protein
MAEETAAASPRDATPGGDAGGNGSPPQSSSPTRNAAAAGAGAAAAVAAAAAATPTVEVDAATPRSAATPRASEASPSSSSRPSTMLQPQGGAPQQTSLMVVVRSRPVLVEEQLRGVRKDILRVMDEKMVVVLDPDEEKGYLDRAAHRSKERRYTFDVAFGKTANNRDVYEATAKDLIGGVLNGHNGGAVHVDSP